MSIRVRNVDLHVLNLRTRMPFRYGIAALTAVPHVFVRAELEVGGVRRHGVAAESLVPKWFTKNLATSYEDDLADLLRVIRSACSLAKNLCEGATVFDLWKAIYAEQESWEKEMGYPPLLWAFGVTLVERAMIEAFCRATDISFAHAVGINTLGIRLGDIHEELEGFEPGQFLPTRPLRSLIARHTVGLGDPLTRTEIPDSERLDDGLPQSLEECIRTYGLTHFKIKLAGDPAKDRDRLARIASVLGSKVRKEYAFTLDANENYHEIEPFRELWRSLAGDASLASFLERLLFVEQPFHRDIALGDGTCAALRSWKERPPMIVDESDSALESARRALDCGYVGTSHKNCKGVFKGIANACLIKFRCRRNPAELFVMSGEDLSSVGPVALLQDLAVLATLGISHAERNGHHYFTGLSMFPKDVQKQVLAHHGDLYRRHRRGFATVAIRGGRIEMGSVVESPFGPGFEFDPTRFTPLEEWRFDSLGA